MPVVSEEATSASIKARMYLGGLKSLFAELHEAIEEAEKTGVVTEGLLSNIKDLKVAIDIATTMFDHPSISAKSTRQGGRCCDHATQADQ